MLKRMREDIDTVLRLDPAARSRLEVILCYPGFHAVLCHRLAHWLWGHGWLVLGRFVSNLGRILTGVEIHPGATLGHRLFIDHGAGVVIGETAEIGDDVTLYQGVTLGGTTLGRGKRHPTLEDGVIVGAGANAVVLHAVAASTHVAGIPAKPLGVAVEAPRAKDFLPYGTPCEDLPDPVARCVAGLMDEVANLQKRLAELESRADNGSVVSFPDGEPAVPARPRGRRLDVGE